jgi:hypothetical protein
VAGPRGSECRPRALLDQGRRRADVLEPEGDLAEDGAEDDLLLRLLEDGRHRSRQAGRAHAPRVVPADLDGAGEPAAVEVRDEAGERAQERRLPGAGRPEQHDPLARLDGQRDAVQRRPRSARVGERELRDAR